MEELNGKFLGMSSANARIMFVLNYMKKQNEITEA